MEFENIYVQNFLLRSATKEERNASWKKWYHNMNWKQKEAHLKAQSIRNKKRRRINKIKKRWALIQGDKA